MCLLWWSITFLWMNKNALRIFPLCQSVFSFWDLIWETKLQNYFIYHLGIWQTNIAGLNIIFPREKRKWGKQGSANWGGRSHERQRHMILLFRSLARLLQRLSSLLRNTNNHRLLFGRFLLMEDSWISAINSIIFLKIWRVSASHRVRTKMEGTFLVGQHPHWNHPWAW